MNTTVVKLTVFLIAWAFLALISWQSPRINGMAHAFLRPLIWLVSDPSPAAAPAGDDEVSVELLRLRAVENRLRKIETDLGLRPADRWRITAAAVTGRDPLAWDTSFRINRGQADQIVAGSAVMAGGVVVGTVLSASRHSAVVRTLLAPDSKLGIQLRTSGGVGILRGRHGERTLCLADYLDRDLPYQVGEEVVTSGLSDVIPGGLPVGKVAPWDVDRVANITDMSYAQLCVRTPTIPGDIRYVWVVGRRQYPPSSAATPPGAN